VLLRGFNEKSPWIAPQLKVLRELTFVARVSAMETRFLSHILISNLGVLCVRNAEDFQESIKDDGNLVLLVLLRLVGERKLEGLVYTVID
jgi:hypothetical protein